MKHEITATLIAVCGIFFLGECSPSVTHHVSRIALGTVVNITIAAESHDIAARAAEAAFAEIERIEALMSPKIATSDVARANRDAASYPVAISLETFDLINRAKKISDDTDGAFDISFASISHLWNFDKKPFIPPKPHDVQLLLNNFTSKNIVLDVHKKTVQYKTKRVKIGLGGIAKGYAIFRAMEVLRRYGIRHAIVDAGGDLMVIGHKGNEPWKVGLAHPRSKGILAVIDMQNGDSIATSGDYERFAMYNGVRYHHILNPNTGFPATGSISVSVMCDDPVLADAYATAFFVMGRKRAFELLKKHTRMRAIVIEQDMKVFASKSLKGGIRFLDEVEVQWVR